MRFVRTSLTVGVLSDLEIGVLLIMLNRFHNYVVEQLAVINENGRFHKVTQADSVAPMLSDG